MLRVAKRVKKKLFSKTITGNSGRATVGEIIVKYMGGWGLSEIFI